MANKDTDNILPAVTEIKLRYKPEEFRAVSRAAHREGLLPAQYVKKKVHDSVYAEQVARILRSPATLSPMHEDHFEQHIHIARIACARLIRILGRPEVTDEMFDDFLGLKAPINLEHVYELPTVQAATKTFRNNLRAGIAKNSPSLNRAITLLYVSFRPVTSTDPDIPAPPIPPLLNPVDDLPGWAMYALITIIYCVVSCEISRIKAEAR